MNKRSLLFALLIFQATISFSQHLDFYYSYKHEGVGSYQKTNFERGVISMDVAAKKFIIRRLQDSTVVPIKKVEFLTAKNAWRFSIKLDKDEDYLSWTGFDVYLNPKGEVDQVSNSFSSKGDRREFYDYGYYTRPPLGLWEKISLMLKKPEIAIGTEGDIRNDEFAFYQPILANEGLKIYSTIMHRGNDSLRISKWDTETKTDIPGYSLMIDPDSYALIKDNARNGVYFRANDLEDSTLSYDFVWALNTHIDHLNYVLEMAQYRKGVFQKLEIFANELSDERNDKNYVPYVAPVEGMCSKCKGKGYQIMPFNCSKCKGSGQRKSWVYRSSDQVVKTDIHNDGSRTVTYLPQGSSTNYYGCSECKGTGRTLWTCDKCNGKGKVMETRE